LHSSELNKPNENIGLTHFSGSESCAGVRLQPTRRRGTDGGTTHLKVGYS
jgi:hypothetical protein